MSYLLKLSPQRQLTLPKEVVELMGSPSYFEGRIVKRQLILEAHLNMTLAEADAAWGKHGITREVLREAIRIVDARKAGGSGTG